MSLFTKKRKEEYAYKARRIDKMRIKKRELKIYLFIILLCALISMASVLVTEFFTEKLPRTIRQIENEYIREVAEKATGKKIDDIALERIKKKYKYSEEKKR